MTIRNKKTKIKNKLWALFLSLGAWLFANPAQAVEYFQLSSGKYFTNYRAENAALTVTEFRYGSYLTRELSLEMGLALGSSSKEILQHGTTYDISNNPTTITWLGRDSVFRSAKVDLKLDHTFGIYASYRWIVSRFDLTARAGLVHIAYVATFNATDAIINGATTAKYSEELGSSEIGFSLGLSGLMLINDTLSVLAEWQTLPRVGDSVRNGDTTKVSAYSFLLGARVLF